MFLESTGALWQQGRLADKVHPVFTASSTAHGGQESTLLAFGQHVLPTGTSHVAGDGPPTEVALEAASFQARRAVDTAAALKAGRAA